MKKLTRITTIPMSLNLLLKNQLKFLSAHFNVTAISGKGEDLDIVRKREAVNVFSIEMERKISPFKDLISLLRLYRYFRKERPEIIHSITPKAGLLSMVAGKLANVPIRMHTFTGLIFPSKTGFMQKVLIQMDKILCYCATNVYPEGNGVKVDLIKFNITSKPLKVLANGNVNGIDLKYFNINTISEEQTNSLKNELKIKSTDFVFIFVGRLVGDKGINELIAAFKNVDNKCPQNSIKLLLVGSLEIYLDPLNNDSLNEIQNNPNIISVGFQQDVRQYFAISNVLVFPSYREGFPNVVMQAGAMHLPSIVTNINGCNEIIVEGINGTIVSVKDTDAICTAMLNFVYDEKYLNLLKGNARRMIEERYDQSVVWNALLKEYNTLLKEKNNV
ncbi:glycosyltransferase family 4 protein [Chryseobacterium wangxinyae]|uniref:glycosyltransferase family 4 protein n=1 Tax=Chryseobacterium sp. CY353 TaxID=2997334 RepID=UPI002D1E461A|nr:glycosyltransferase family 4 protein [Chryseobacterium sp. CY353]